MEHFVYIFGWISLVVFGFLLVFILGVMFIPSALRLKRDYQDYCYLANLGWTNKQFDDWMKSTRDWSDEEYKEWHAKNTRFWYSWICFKAKPK